MKPSLPCGASCLATVSAAPHRRLLARSGPADQRSASHTSRWLIFLSARSPARGARATALRSLRAEDLFRRIAPLLPSRHDTLNFNETILQAAADRWGAARDAQ